MDDDLKKTGLELAADLGEIGVEKLLEDGLLEGIPIVGIALKVMKLPQQISDHLFIARISRMMKALEKVPKEKCQAFAKQLAENEKDRKKTGECLLLLCSRLDDLEKAELVGKIFRQYVLGMINNEDFRRLALAVDQTFLEDLKALIELYPAKNQAFDEKIRALLEKQPTVVPYLPSLARSGLADFPSPPSRGRGGGGTNRVVGRSFEVSELGKLLVKCLRDEL